MWETRDYPGYPGTPFSPSTVVFERVRQIEAIEGAVGTEQFKEVMRFFDFCSDDKNPNGLCPKKGFRVFLIGTITTNQNSSRCYCLVGNGEHHTILVYAFSDEDPRSPSIHGAIDSMTPEWAHELDHKTQSYLIKGQKLRAFWRELTRTEEDIELDRRLNIDKPGDGSPGYPYIPRTFREKLERARKVL